MNAEPDPYEVLGVRRTATMVEIRAAYAGAVQKLTPGPGGSLSPIAEAHLNLLDAAFRLLSEPESRAHYDGVQPAPPQPESSDFQPEAVPPRKPPIVNHVAPPERTRPLKFGSGITPMAWIGLTLAVVALGRVASGQTPAHWPSLSENAQADAASETTAGSGEAAATGAFLEWKAGDSGDPHTYNVSDLRVTLSTDRGEGGQHLRPRISIVDHSGASISALGDENANPVAARFGVGKIDPEGPDDQVLFLSYSGGAHCCTHVILLERGDGGWRRKDLGSWDGAPLATFPKDVDGDGVVDLVFNDERFAYAFAPYAMSVMPPRVFNVVGGRTVEVSNEVRYRKLYEDQRDAAKTNCLAHNNGACAGYVAIASRLGGRDEAWQTMLGAYDHTSGWLFPTACQTVKVQGACPKGEEITFRSFPAALGWFLVDAGYPYWSPNSAPVDPNRAPSFDCSGVTSVNLKLVCATPALSASDRAIAALYQADLLNSPDPSALRTEERAWTEERNAAAPDIDALQQIYDARTAALQAHSQSAASSPPLAAPTYAAPNTMAPAPPAFAAQHIQPYRQNPALGFGAQRVQSYGQNAAVGYRPYTAARRFMAPVRPPR
jgi:uncharacterized protein/curved DNA-binding protein CbpA